MSISTRSARLMLLYRQSLRNASSWMASRGHWYDEAREIRDRFERNRHIEDPATIDKLLAEGEAELREKLHPDPYTAPYNPGGTLYGRNPPPPLNVIEMDFGREKGAH